MFTAVWTNYRWDYRGLFLPSGSFKTHSHSSNDTFTLRCGTLQEISPVAFICFKAYTENIAGFAPTCMTVTSPLADIHVTDTCLMHHVTWRVLTGFFIKACDLEL